MGLILDPLDLVPTTWRSRADKRVGLDFLYGAMGRLTPLFDINWDPLRDI